jgi:hypothetical protein
MASISRKSMPRSLVRDLVRATHRWPLLGSAYRGIYKAAADSVARLAEANSQIAGIYARNSYALGTWEPGRSDIDLTVVWRGPSEEAIALFHSAYAKLQERFPMLGEVEMIDEQHLGAWIRHGFSGFQSQNWKKLAGDHDLLCEYEGSEQFDRVRHAIAVYRYQFLKYFWERPRGPAAERAAAKLMRILGRPPMKESSVDRMWEACLRELATAVKTTAAPAEGPLVDYAELIGRVSVAASQTDGETLSINGLQSVIASAPDAAQKHVLVEGYSDLAKIEAVFPCAIVWEPNVFRFYLCFLDPLEYFSLLRERTLFHGEDPLREPFGLTKSALRDSITHYSVEMLTFPYRAGLAGLSDGDFRNFVYGWYLRTLRYFEDGIVDFDYYSLRQHFKNRHSEDVGRFPLLHGIAGELSGHLRV